MEPVTAVNFIGIYILYNVHISCKVSARYVFNFTEYCKSIPRKQFFIELFIDNKNKAYILLDFFTVVFAHPHLYLSFISNICRLFCIGPVQVQYKKPL